MSSVEAPSRIFEEIAALFASAPSAQKILEFQPSDQTRKRASELLELNRSGGLDGQSSVELDQYEQAELIMRLVKAHIRSSENANANQS